MTSPNMFTTAILTLFTTAAPAFAQNPQANDGWSFGAAAAVTTNPYVGEDTEVILYPSIHYRNGPLSIGTLGIEYEVYENGGLAFTAGIVPRFTGLFSTDAPELDGIDREITGDVALGLEYDSGSGFRTGITFQQEITGEHDGQELVWDIGYGIPVNDVALEVSAGAAWQNKDLSAYIWGVSSSEARPDRPAYAPGDVVIPFASFSALMPLSEHWTLVGTVRADFLSGDVSDSPIVDRGNIYSAILGVTYSF